MVSWRFEKNHKNPYFSIFLVSILIVKFRPNTFFILFPFFFLFCDPCRHAKSNFPIIYWIFLHLCVFFRIHTIDVILYFVNSVETRQIWSLVIMLVFFGKLNISPGNRIFTKAHIFRKTYILCFGFWDGQKIKNKLQKVQKMCWIRFLRWVYWQKIRKNKFFIIFLNTSGNHIYSNISSIVEDRNA